MILLVIDTQKLIVTDSLHNYVEFKENISSLISQARKHGVEVVYICHDDGVDSDLTPGREGFEVFADFKPLEGEQMFVKSYNSAFKQTKLNDYLKQQSVNDLIVCGLQTDLCIDATIKSGFEQGYNLIVAAGCNSTVDNHLISAELAVEYYNEYIWPDRYASIIGLDDISELMLIYQENH